MKVKTLEEVRERITELGKEIEKEIGETEKPIHAEAANQGFPGETREKTALYRKLQRAEKLLSEAENEEADEAKKKLSEASKVLKQEDQAYIDEEGLEELKDFASKIDQERTSGRP